MRNSLQTGPFLILLYVLALFFGTAGLSLGGPLALTTSSDPTPLSLARAPPYPELYVVIESVGKTRLFHHAPTTHFLGFLRRCATLRKEQVGVNPETVRLELPTQVLVARLEVSAHC